MDRLFDSGSDFESLFHAPTISLQEQLLTLVLSENTTNSRR